MAVHATTIRFKSLVDWMPAAPPRRKNPEQDTDTSAYFFDGGGGKLLSGTNTLCPRDFIIGLSLNEPLH